MDIWPAANIHSIMGFTFMLCCSFYLDYGTCATTFMAKHNCSSFSEEPSQPACLSLMDLTLWLSWLECWLVTLSVLSTHCNGGYFSETSLRPRIPPARPRDPVIHIKPQAPKARGYCDCCRCLIRIQVRNKEQSLSPEPRLNGECWDTVTLAQSALNWSG